MQSYAAQTAARGTAILTVDALHMVLIAALVFLILRQVMPIASGLAGGASLNSFGFVSRSVSGGLQGAGKLAGPRLASAAKYVAPRIGGMARGTATNLRDRAANLRSTVARSQPNGTDADVAALSRRLRDMRLL